MPTVPSESAGVPEVSTEAAMALSASSETLFVNAVAVSARRRSVPPFRAKEPVPSEVAARSSTAPELIRAVPVKFAFAPVRMRSPAPVFTSVLALLPVARRSLAPPTVRVCPPATSSVLVSPAVMRRRCPTFAVNPEVIMSVPPLRKMSFVTAPSAASVAMESAPSLRKMSPLKVFAPPSTRVPRSDFARPTTPSPALP